MNPLRREGAGAATQPLVAARRTGLGVLRVPGVSGALVVLTFAPGARAQGPSAQGGPFPAGPAGGMMITQPGVGAKEISTFAQADPAVRSGLLKAEVRPWLIGMKP